MNPKLVPLRTLLALFGMLLFLSSCGGGQSDCPTCGTAQNGPIGLLNIMYVPEHNPTGLPGGPFISFDIGWVDPNYHLYSITDRLGVDVAEFSTTSNVALWAIGGDNTVAENGNDASRCWTTATQTIPPVVTAQGNYTRFACKSWVGATYAAGLPVAGTGFQFSVPGVAGLPGPQGKAPDTANINSVHFGGFTGGICCSPRAAQLNPLSGPNGVEKTIDGNFAVISSPTSLFVFDLRPMITSGYTAAPLIIAAIPTGASPDYDGPAGVGPCTASAQNRAFTDPTCGDLRADELGTTGGVVGPFADGKNHFLVGLINGDPGLPFFSIIDLTEVIQPTPGATGTQLLQQHCLPYNANAPFSPGSPVNAAQTPPEYANYSTCMVGQIYYDGAGVNDNSVVVDNNLPCPDPSVFFTGTTVNNTGVVPPNMAGVPVASGASGIPFGSPGALALGASGLAQVAGSLNPVIPCHHGPMLASSTTNIPQVGGAYCTKQGTASTAAGGANCTGSFAPSGSVGPAGLGGLIYFPPTKKFLLTNGNTIGDITVGSLDEIDPLHPFPGGVYGPFVTNSFPIYNCMPTGVSAGPGTDVLVSCADHDGRAFAPSAVILNGATGEILKTINNIGYTDQTWYNPGDNNYYLASGGFPTGPVLGVIDAGSRTWLQNVPTQGNAHSVAADPISNQIYVPLGTGPQCLAQSAVGCVGIFGKQ